MQKIALETDVFTALELKELFDQEAAGQYVSEIDDTSAKYRGLPFLAILVPQLLPNIVAGVVALLVTILTRRANGKIVIRYADGATIEVPANTPKQKIDALLAQVRRDETPRIVIARN